MCVCVCVYVYVCQLLNPPQQRCVCACVCVCGGAGVRDLFCGEGARGEASLFYFEVDGWCLTHAIGGRGRTLKIETCRTNL